MLKRTLALLVLLSLAPGAAAESVWIGGSSLSKDAQAAWLGRVAPWPGESFGDGWTWSVFADHSRYRYSVGAREIDGRSSAIKLGVAREATFEAGVLSAGAGVALRRVETSPFDPGNEAEGDEVHPVGEVQWRSLPAAPRVTQAFAQYVAGARSHQAVVFAGGRMADGSAVGVQASTGGDPTYRQHGLALAWRDVRLGGAEFGFHVGARHQEGAGTDPEVGFSVVLYRP